MPKNAALFESITNETTSQKLFACQLILFFINHGNDRVLSMLIL